jgi:hypothetical protein
MSVARGQAVYASMMGAWPPATAGGVSGFFERLFAPRVLRRIYADELERLDRYAHGAA